MKIFWDQSCRKLGHRRNDDGTCKTCSRSINLALVAIMLFSAVVLTVILSGGFSPNP